MYFDYFSAGFLAYLPVFTAGDEYLTLFYHIENIILPAVIKFLQCIVKEQYRILSHAFVMYLPFGKFYGKGCRSRLTLGRK